MAQAFKEQSNVTIPCPVCGQPMTHSKRTALEKHHGLDIEKLNCERCGFELPNLIDTNSK
jgi:C4-type Zn-finger protein